MTSSVTKPISVVFEFDGKLYVLPESQATLLGENLHNFAKGVFPRDVELASRFANNPNWTEGAEPVFAIIEDVLRGDWDMPIPLAGKAALATYCALQLMQGLQGSLRPDDAAALRDHLRTRL